MQPNSSSDPMSNSPELYKLMMHALKQQHSDHLDRYVFPPPVFVAMQGEFLAYDSQNLVLSVRFPVLERWLNPYGIMQGGMIAAAMDNTIGPLSALVAPANVTRHMDLKYSRSVTPQMGHINIKAYLVERNGPWLNFKVEASDPQGRRLVRATARHWILSS